MTGDSERLSGLLRSSGDSNGSADHVGKRRSSKNNTNVYNPTAHLHETLRPVFSQCVRHAKHCCGVVGSTEQSSAYNLRCISL